MAFTLLTSIVDQEGDKVIVTDKDGKVVTITDQEGDKGTVTDLGRPGVSTGQVIGLLICLTYQT